MVLLLNLLLASAELLRADLEELFAVYDGLCLRYSGEQIRNYHLFCAGTRTREERRRDLRNVSGESALSRVTRILTAQHSAESGPRV